MSLSQHAMELLNYIEEQEMRSLSWGSVEGSLGEDEALDHLGGGEQAEEALEELLDAHLVSELTSISGKIRYRSRFAEAVRLLATNRQLFDNRPWQSAPRLVADFRVDRRPRRFPQRDRDPGTVFAQHAGLIAPTSLRKAIWEALTRVPGMRLAGFQERAIARLAKPANNGATIVTAGTGSGKTLAFYLPAMLLIGDAIDHTHWVKALAIYPRIELLKDQFAEAFRMARNIDGTLTTQKRRPLIIGALFAATPKTASVRDIDSKEWICRGRDFVCPWMNCPSCGAEMLWRWDDLQAARERLVCSGTHCATVADERQIILTRHRIQQHPPDILFTTTEMLNQRLSDHWFQKALGTSPGRKPFLALLDEVHTYEGTSGAQAALTMRRWHHLVNSPVHWVGLSATLNQAARFFADLTGAQPENVVLITPADEEMTEEGAEYQVLLRSNPATWASTLSTTIQTAMLVARILEPMQSKNTTGTFGRRVFLFTDDLDVTNRLYDNLRDAEAYTIHGRPNPGRLPLAALRAVGQDNRARDLEGQRWKLCEEIGHHLHHRLVVGRTSSQDAGVLRDANVIVATASLEVGFNDPHVGAVIQHKSPRAMASFLQRKGRAGRQRAMRPLTLTVLSDYGQDRAMYQSFERLFDPELESQHLPIANPYVLKMQATFALFDWLAKESVGSENAWAWHLLSSPQDAISIQNKAVLTRYKAKLSALVQGKEAVITSLRQHLMDSLRVNLETAESLLWEAPRSLLLEAVPTLVRRLFRDWKLVFSQAGVTHDLYVPYHPLPDFVPRNLFSDLNLPEVNILVPPATIDSDWRTETMPVLSALRQLTPGRVTRRFAYERGGLSHWAPLMLQSGEQRLHIDDYAEESEYVGTFHGRFNDQLDGEHLLVYRPWTVRLAVADRAVVLPSSNAHLLWHTDIVAHGAPMTVPVGPHSPWRTYVDDVNFFLHRFRASAEVRRFAPQADANLLTLRDDHTVHVRFIGTDDRPAAIGFALEVDGFRLELTLPERYQWSAKKLTPALLRDCKLGYLAERFREDATLPVEINHFQRDWLFQILCAALADAVAEGDDLAAASDKLLSDQHIDAAFTQVMDLFFGSQPPPSADEQEQEEQYWDDWETDDDSSMPSTPQKIGRLQQTLSALVTQPEVRAGLRAVAEEFISPDAAAFDGWIRRMILSTLGEAMRQACIEAAPRQTTLDNLLVDIREDLVLGRATIWITETTLGGAGALQAFAERFSAEPSAFFTAVEAVLAPTDLELVDEGLRHVLSLSQSDGDVSSCLHDLRHTNSHAESAAIWQRFVPLLSQKGGAGLSHAYKVALNSRMIRAGSGPELDQLLAELLRFWTQTEECFDCTIHLREFAYLACRDAHWNQRIGTVLQASLPTDASAAVNVYGAVFGMLWPRAAQVRKSNLKFYHPYCKSRSTDPAVVRHLLLRRTVREVSLASATWRDDLLKALADTGACRLIAPTTQSAALRRELVLFGATAVDVGVLQFYPVIDRIERSDGHILVDLILREHY